MQHGFHAYDHGIHHDGCIRAAVFRRHGGIGRGRVGYCNDVLEFYDLCRRDISNGGIIIIIFATACIVSNRCRCCCSIILG